jgi:hypothetical protein
LSFQVCSQCLVSHNVPVHRPSNGKWEFGQVLLYDATREMHRIVFIDNKKEWIQIAEDSYAEYIQEFVVNEDQTQVQSITCSTISFPTPYEDDPEPPEKVGLEILRFSRLIIPYTNLSESKYTIFCLFT